MYFPDPPGITLEQLRTEDPELYKIYKSIIDHFAREAYKSPEANEYGLEGCIEGVEELIEEGWIKPLWDEDTDTISMGCFNPETGKYDLQECDF